MTDVFLADIGYSMGDLKETVDDAAAAGLLVSDAESLVRAGFRYHYRCSPELRSYDLARGAVLELGEEARTCDFLFYATCLPGNAVVDNARPDRPVSRDVKALMGYAGSQLQVDLGLENAAVVGVGQQACTGLLGAIRLARALLVAEERAATAVCVTADRFPEGAQYEQAYNLISDGAAACIVTTERRGFKIVAAHHRTNGALAVASDDETVGAFFNNTHRAMTETMRLAGQTPGDLDWVVPQNTNATAWQIMARVAGLPLARVWFPTLPDVAHMISGDNLVNLDSLARSGELSAGDRILLVMAGYGMNWQCLLLEAV